MGKSYKKHPGGGTSKKKKKKISPMMDFMAGSYSGVMATIVGHPFDTVSVARRPEALLDDPEPRKIHTGKSENADIE